MTKQKLTQSEAIAIIKKLSKKDDEPKVDYSKKAIIALEQLNKDIDRLISDKEDVIEFVERMKQYVKETEKAIESRDQIIEKFMKQYVKETDKAIESRDRIIEKLVNCINENSDLDLSIDRTRTIEGYEDE